VTQRDPYGVNPDEYLSPILERELSILFEKEIAYHREIEIIKRDLFNSPDFTIEAAFKEIDEEGLNVIDHVSVEGFLKRNGFAATEEELTAIIRRIDVSADASASYAEFDEALKPVEVGRNQEEQYQINRNYEGSDSYRSRGVAPKLANPSKVKLENLKSGGYYGFDSSEEKDFVKKKAPARENNPYNSEKMQKKYNPEELPISKSHYQQ
jgi:Ca2+-binding EF-hand superfamily protein